MPLPSTYRARLKEKLVFTHDVRDFVIELLEPTTLDFKAGQFVLIKTKHPETGELLSRAYSVASAPAQSSELVFNVEIVEQGKLTPLMEQWEVGCDVELQGPFGHFYFKSPEDKAILFVATGTGIAPFRSMIEDLLDKGDTRPLHLIFGVRYAADIFYRELFEGLAAQHSNFKFTITLTRPDESWTGAQGRVTEHLKTMELDPSGTHVYLCGGKPMIDDAKQILMERGFEKSSLFFEQFFL